MKQFILILYYNSFIYIKKFHFIRITLLIIKIIETTRMNKNMTLDFIYLFL